MPIAEKIPEMTDDALESLQANALRLQQAGTAKQQEAALALMPLIDAELAARAALRPPKPARKPPVRKKAQS